MRLNELSDRPGATRERKRRGRGIGSGLGKTAGRGTKGQKARAGVAIKGFEGGQMPLHRRLPKRGFNNIFAKKFNEVNLGKVQSAIEAGRLDGKSPITVDALVAAGLIRRAHDGVRLLGHGEIKGKVDFHVAGASASAVKAVEAAGGTVTIIKIVRANEARPRKERPPKGKRQAAAASQEARPEKPEKAAKAEPEADAKPAKGKGETTEAAPKQAEKKAKPPQAEAAAEKPEKKAKTSEADAKKPKAKPAKKDKSE
jgi:large subunit ribosomal protein L15